MKAGDEHRFAVEGQGPRGLIFDLFGTLVSIEISLLPRVEDEGCSRVETIPGLDQLLSRLRPRMSAEQFSSRLMEVSQAIFEEKRRDNVEITSVKRFEMVLEAMGFSGDLAAVAMEMSSRHMQSLRGAVVCPRGRREALRELSLRYPMALLSNFDHAATARAILADTGLLEFFRQVVISDDMALRKPDPHLFFAACDGLNLLPGSCLHIGDSFVEDVQGAVAAGLRAVWIHDGGGDPSPALDALNDVSELPGWLERRFGKAGLAKPFSETGGGPR